MLAPGFTFHFPIHKRSVSWDTLLKYCYPFIRSLCVSKLLQHLMFYLEFATWIQTNWYIPIDRPNELHKKLFFISFKYHKKGSYHRFPWNGTFKIKTPAESFHLFPSIIRRMFACQISISHKRSRKLLHSTQFNYHYILFTIKWNKMLEYDNIYNKNIPKMVKTRLTIQIWLKKLISPALE